MSHRGASSPARSALAFRVSQKIISIPIHSQELFQATSPSSSSATTLPFTMHITSTVILSLSALAPFVQGLGINCRGSSNCAFASKDAMSNIQGKISSIPDSQIYCGCAHNGDTRTMLLTSPQSMATSLRTMVTSARSFRGRMAPRTRARSRVTFKRWSTMAAR